MGRNNKEPHGVVVMTTLVLLSLIALWISSASQPSTAASSMTSAVWNFILWLAALGLLATSVARYFPKRSVGKQSTTRKKSRAQVVNEAIQGPSPVAAGWSKTYIGSLNWHVFEKLCMTLWGLKGFKVDGARRGADGGVGFYLCAGSSRMRIGAVQCKSSRWQQVDVEVVRKLQEVVAAERIELGILMYSGMLSQAAADFLNQPDVTIKAQNAEQILDQIYTLPADDQMALLQQVTASNQVTPSCPRCDVTLVRRANLATDRLHLACPNYPACKYTVAS